MEILEQIEKKVEDAIERITKLQERVHQLEEEKKNYEQQCKDLLGRLENAEDDRPSESEDSEISEPLEANYENENTEELNASENQESESNTYEDHTPEGDGNNENSNDVSQHNPSDGSYFAADEGESQQHY